jgi:hypothetical protein
MKLTIYKVQVRFLLVPNHSAGGGGGRRRQSKGVEKPTAMTFNIFLFYASPFTRVIICYQLLQCGGPFRLFSGYNVCTAPA